MNTITFDTHKFVKRLIAAGMPDEQAEVLAEAVSEAHIADLSHLATKADLAEAKTEIIRWLVPLLLGQAGLIVALIKLL